MTTFDYVYWIILAMLAGWGAMDLAMRAIAWRSDRRSDDRSLENLRRTLGGRR